MKKRGDRVERHFSAPRVYCNNESDKSGLTVSDTINAGKFVLSTDVKYSDREAVQKQ